MGLRSLSGPSTHRPHRKNFSVRASFNGRMSVFQTVRRGFESLRPHQLIQFLCSSMVEQRAVNSWDVRSTRTGGANLRLFHSLGEMPSNSLGDAFLHGSVV